MGLVGVGLGVGSQWISVPNTVPAQQVTALAVLAQGDGGWLLMDKYQIVVFYLFLTMIHLGLTKV